LVVPTSIGATVPIRSPIRRPFFDPSKGVSGLSLVNTGLGNFEQL
jgi:hypothetical protein